MHFANTPAPTFDESKVARAAVAGCRISPTRWPSPPRTSNATTPGQSNFVNRSDRARARCR